MVKEDKAESSAPVQFDYFENDNVDDKQQNLLLLVPEQCVATIIGPGATTIMQIQSSTSTKIVLQASRQMVPGQRKRRITIIGSIKAANIAQYLISMKVAEKLLTEVPGSQGLLSSTGRVAPTQELQMLVPNESVSFVIGRQGATVKEVQVRSGCKIRIEKEQEMLPGLGGRLVTITGSQRGRLLAQYLVA